MVNNGTIASTVAGIIRGGGNNGFTFENNGVIDSTGGTLSIGDGGTDRFTNAAGATVDADGGNITMGTAGATVTNFSGNTLTGGTWIASGAATLAFENMDNSIIINGLSTTLELSGAGSSITSGASSLPLEQTLTTNDGTLEILANRNFASTSNGLTNNGILQLGGGTLTASSLTNTPGSQIVGTGTLSPTGGVTIGSGVLVSPGTTGAHAYVGAMTFNSATLGPGGAFAFDVADASGTAGTGYDTIAVAGALNVTATSPMPFTIDLRSIDPGTGAPGLATFNPNSSYQWTLLSAASVTGFNPSDFALNTALFANGPGTSGFSLSSSGTDIFLNFTPVPEPSTWSMIGAGAAAVGLAALRRRRVRT
jgi:hypothetical protein